MEYGQSVVYLGFGCFKMEYADMSTVNMHIVVYCVTNTIVLISTGVSSLSIFFSVFRFGFELSFLIRCSRTLGVCY